MAETNAHTEVPADGKVMFPPFQKETFPSQLFWLVITFIVLYVVMARIALPLIGAIFQARCDRISGDLAEVERGLLSDSVGSISMAPCTTNGNIP
jgi:F-type H+-transporting ATPase subunit b